MTERIDKYLFKPVDHVVYLDVFYDRIITKLANIQQSSVSETLKHIIINWVNEHHDFLKKDHKINFKEIMDNIKQEKLTWKTMIGKKIKKTDHDQVIKDAIKKLVKYSELFNEIKFDILAKQLEISRKLLKEIIFDHKSKLEKLGVKLQIRGKLIVKE